MIRALLVLTLLAGAAVAAPVSSLRPVARDGGLRIEPSGSIMPPGRPAGAETAGKPAGGLLQSLRPFLRSRKVEQAGTAQRELRARGAVCGDIEIQGKAIGSVGHQSQSCGVADAVQIQSVAGVRLSQTAVVDCTTAKALKTWVEETAKPTFAKQGGLKGLRVAAHYICRTRNNQPGSKVSEHGRGRAIDISGFQLGSGAEISVLKGWNAASSSRALRRLHKGACGPFGTVLGPNSDRFHQDHFHFDTAQYRSGSYCR